MSDIDQLKALVRAYLQAQEDVAECQDRRGLLCDEPECEDCEIQDGMLDARTALQMWMKEHQCKPLPGAATSGGKGGVR